MYIMVVCRFRSLRVKGPEFRLGPQEPTFFGGYTVRDDFIDDLIREYKAIAISDGFFIFTRLGKYPVWENSWERRC